jgi:hypothetical protein
VEPGPLEVYKIVVDDTNQMLARRQGLDSIYVTETGFSPPQAAGLQPRRLGAVA